MTTPRKLIHRMTIPVRWGDMDALGHVNNTEYFRYMEQARIDWMEQLGLPVLSQGEGPVIVATACQFRKPVVYPATVEVTIYADPPGRSSVQHHYELRVVGDASQDIYAEGSAMVVWVNHDMGKSTPLPEAIRQALAGN